MKQFSIRDLLFLILIVALALGWWLDRRPVAARYQMHVTTNHAYVIDTATGEVWSQKVVGDGDLTGGTGDLHPPKLPKP